MTTPYQDSALPRNPEKSGKARERHPAAPLSPPLGMRGIAVSRSLRSFGMLGTLEIQRVLPKRKRGPREALVWGWPTTIRMNARTELPTLPGKPVYGPDAREEVRRIMREAKRAGINLGWFTKKSLCKVAKGERPLSYSVWDRTQAYMRHIQREREHEKDMRERPLQRRFVPGKGLLVGWRRGFPIVPASRSTDAPGGSPPA